MKLVKALVKRPNISPNISYNIQPTIDRCPNSSGQTIQHLTQHLSRHSTRILPDIWPSIWPDTWPNIWPNIFSCASYPTCFFMAAVVHYTMLDTVVKRSNNCLNISEQRNGWASSPNILFSVKFHPTSKVTMFGDPTWWSNDPTFQLTSCWVRCWVVWRVLNANGAALLLVAPCFFSQRWLWYRARALCAKPWAQSLVESYHRL